MQLRVYVRGHVRTQDSVLFPDSSSKFLFCRAAPRVCVLCQPTISDAMRNEEDAKNMIGSDYRY